MPCPVLKRKEWFHPDGFPIAVERRDPQQPFGRHSHEFAEIVIVTAGRGVHVTGKKAYLLNAGDAFVIGGLRQHDYRRMQHLCLVNILFQPDQLNLHTQDLHSLPGYRALFTLDPVYRKQHPFSGPLRLTPSELSVVTAFVEKLEKELGTRGKGFKFMATALFMQLIGYLSRCYAKPKRSDSRALRCVAASISHLEANYEKHICLDQLAKIAHMSGRSFLRSFQAAMGSSPIAYAIELRINRGALLLRQTELSVTEIAFKIGFNDSNYFTRQFRKLLGVTPRRYRQQHALRC